MFVVGGMTRFRDHFSAYADRYVPIGGIRCRSPLSARGTSFPRSQGDS